MRGEEEMTVLNDALLDVLDGSSKKVVLDGQRRLVLIVGARVRWRI
jgi:hypothetical protein